MRYWRVERMTESGFSRFLKGRGFAPSVWSSSTGAWVCSTSFLLAGHGAGK